jgi:hypothetical protein
MTWGALVVRLSVVVGAAVTWLLWTAGPAGACAVTYQAGPAGAACGGGVPAVAAAAVAATAAAGVGAAVAVAARGGSSRYDLETLDRELADAQADVWTGMSDEEIAFRDDVARRLNEGDPAILRLYRTGLQGEMTIPRVSADTKVGPFQLPVVERGSDGLYRLKEQRETIRAVLRLGSDGTPWEYRHGRSGMDPEALVAADYLSHARASNLKNLREARQSVREGPLPDSRFGSADPVGLDDRSGHNYLATLWGELLGEHAGVHAASTHLRPRFPGHDIERLLVGELGGPGTFDDIYRVRGPDGSVGIIVLETKSPDAALGGRNVGDLRYEQGHLEYLKSVIGEMRKKGRFGGVPDELEDALGAGRLGYFSVRALATQSGGLPHTEMTATKLAELWRKADEAADAALEQHHTAEEAARIHREMRIEAVHGAVAYGGYQIMQFDLGLDWP